MRCCFVCLLCFSVALIAAPCVAQKREIHTADQPLAPLEAARTMLVPEGFRVTLFAGEPDVMQPIGFCLDDRGRLWVAEAYNYPNHGTRPGDRIIILEDSDGDGEHDRRTVFCDGLNYVTGIEVGFGGVWVMSPPNMYFIPDRDGDDIPDAEPQILLDGFGNHANAHNLANGFAWGPDGWLYATHGRTNWSMIGKPGDDETQRRRFDGGVWRYHPVRHVWEPFADGTTNPWGIDWNDYGDAFVCNCVNPHLFQVIQGAHYEPWRSRKSSEFAYQRIDTIADHLHFVGLGNVRNGLGSEAEDMAGGGHAHCGTMIYLGDQFPAAYRNQLFTNNIHGRRINNDLLRRSGSGYVASHGRDLMRSRDPWFMGVTLAGGPGGEVYVSDWSDTGECHSTRDTRRDTGRIYRLTYLATQIDRVDLAKMPDEELVELQKHDNDWLVRHARRLLQERAMGSSTRSATMMAATHRALRQILDSEQHPPKRLRGLWALQVTGGLSQDALVALMHDRDESVRGWSVRLLCETGDPPTDAVSQMIALAKEGVSPRVRLELASALQRLTPGARWPLAEALAGRGEDANDQNLPLMLWYGVEPLIEDDLQRYVRLAARASISRVRENMARRIASSAQSDPGLDLLAGVLADDEYAAARGSLLRGILVGLEDRRRVTMPASWPAAYEKLSGDSDPQVPQQAMRLALLFNDENAIRTLRSIAVDGKSNDESRRQAINALVASETKGFDHQLMGLLDDPAVRGEALRGLSRYASDGTAQAIIARYANYTTQERQFALQTLASRRTWAQRLMDAIERNTIPASDLTAFTARQLRSLADEETSSRLSRLWGEVRETPRERAAQIEQLRKTLTSDVLADADLARGEQLFKKQCASCHRFFGEGGSVGPDLTGAQRTNLQYLLENIIDPSASVAKEYRMEVVRMDDGRVMTGLVESESERSITIINANDKFVIPRDEIEERKQADVSVMPTGMLDAMSEREVRDLLAYLQR